ncbi:hypothetical protein AB4Z25_17905 [Rhizobium sp. RAF36]|uniref:hypothetical protein n=1 Tax=Rhizobium sp. RAF36 TaxID=3233055 RepID=UPI003F95D9C8
MVDPQAIVTVLHMTVSAVEELFRIGLLKGGRRRKNTTRHARRAHISELIEFKKHYISATDAAAEFGLASPKLLVEALTERGVQPVVRTFRNISCVYRRQDIEKAMST